MTDTQGRVLHIEVHPANIHDTKMGYKVFEKALEKYPTLQGFAADMGHRGTTEKYVTSILNKTVEIVKRLAKGWAVNIRNYVIERTFAWLSNYRRLNKIYESSFKSIKAMVYIANARILLKRTKP